MLCIIVSNHGIQHNTGDNICYAMHHCIQSQDTTQYQGYHMLCYASLYLIIGYNTIQRISYAMLCIIVSNYRIQHNTRDIICLAALGYNCMLGYIEAYWILDDFCPILRKFPIFPTNSQVMSLKARSLIFWILSICIFVNSGSACQPS